MRRVTYVRSALDSLSAQALIMSHISVTHYLLIMSHMYTEHWIYYAVHWIHYAVHCKAIRCTDNVPHYHLVMSYMFTVHWIRGEKKGMNDIWSFHNLIVKWSDVVHLLLLVSTLQGNLIVKLSVQCNLIVKLSIQWNSQMSLSDDCEMIRCRSSPSSRQYTARQSSVLNPAHCVYTWQKALIISPLSELSHIYAAHRIFVTYDCVRTVSLVCELSHIRMSHVAYVDGSCRIYGWVMSHMWMSHVTRMNGSCRTYEWVMSPMWMGHVAYMKEMRWMSPVAYVRSAWMSHVTHMKEACI